MVGAIEPSNECEKTKNLLIYCVFFLYSFAISYVFGCQKASMIFLCNGFQFSLHNWKSKHIIIGLFEANYTSGVVMHVKVKTSLWQMFISSNISWFMSKTKGSICTLVQWLSTWLCHVMVSIWLVHLMDIVSGMHTQRYVNMSWFGILHIFVGFPTTTKNCLWIFSMADFLKTKANF